MFNLLQKNVNCGEKSIIEYIINENYNINDYVFVGDRLRTDFDMCKSIGLDFICVLSGETKREEIENENIWPGLIVNSVKDLVALITL